MWPHNIFPKPRGLALRCGMAGVARTAAPAATAAATSRVSGLVAGFALSGGFLGGQGFCFQDDFMLGGSRARRVVEYAASSPLHGQEGRECK